MSGWLEPTSACVQYEGHWSPVTGHWPLAMIQMYRPPPANPKILPGGDGVSLCRLGWRAVARSQLMHLLPPWFKPFSCLSLPDGVSLCRLGWRAVARSQLSASSASMVQAILMPQPPRWSLPLSPRLEGSGTISAHASSASMVQAILMPQPPRWSLPLSPRLEGSGTISAHCIFCLHGSSYSHASASQTEVQWCEHGSLQPQPPGLQQSSDPPTSASWSLPLSPRLEGSGTISAHASSASMVQAILMPQPPRWSLPLSPRLEGSGTISAHCIFCLHGSSYSHASASQTEVQWCEHGSLQPQPPGLQQSSDPPTSASEEETSTGDTKDEVTTLADVWVARANECMCPV
ncbi:uncharacterized protein [Chlorocebus sabaeus]|uniref:uncharacterized protein n=1 Tax=Chlorocebus sabaeus TaxID=60711 RepID=UPI003BF991E8